MTLTDIRRYLPYLGVFVRSASVRNAFEIFGPVRKLARTLLGSPIKLIVSSGWDYRPITFRRESDATALLDFLIIVLPGCESSNPLLLPLAGHELGHAVWEQERLDSITGEQVTLELTRYARAHPDQFSEIKLLNADMSDEVASTILEGLPVPAQASGWLKRQIEEYFCDFVGLYLFGPSFVHAFSYFLSPISGTTSAYYPSVASRIAQLKKASDFFSERWGVENYKMPDLSGAFPTTPPHQEESSGWIGAATTVAIEFVPKLLEKIEELATKPNWNSLRGSSSERDRICKRAFFWAVPAEKVASLADILNAAWEVELNRDFWRDLPSLEPLKEERTAEQIELWDERRRSILAELVLKNIEVFEYEDLTAGLT